MRLLPFTALLGLTSALAINSTRQEAPAGCINPSKRVEIRTLDDAALKQYTDSVVCLATKPSMLGLNTTLYDDFAYIHTRLSQTIHFCSMFLPWHRYFVQIYHEKLQDCGYKGPMVYWDWTLDAADTAHSPIWNLVGGNGGTSRVEKVGTQEFMCLTDGPFKDLRPAYLLTDYAPHCLSRDFTDGKNRPGDMRGSAYNASLIATIHEKKTYADFRLHLESTPHGSVHEAVGGEKGDMEPASSPNDPLFFLHHAQVDRLWYLWQQEDPAVRSVDIKDQKVNPDDGSIAALEDVLPFMKLADDIRMTDVMTTQNELLCYTY